MSLIQPAQTNLLLDPTYAKAETERIFQPQLTMAREFVEESSRLLLRAFAASKRDMTDLILIGVLYRQVVAMFDSAVLNLENGACYASLVPIRGMWEAGIALEWMLLRGKEHYARQYFVAFLRAQRSWASNLILGTPERAVSDGARLKSGKEPFNPAPERIASAREAVESVNYLLAQDIYRDIEAEFEKKKKGPDRDVEWHHPDPGSIYKVAEGLGRLDEYKQIYRYLSYPTHGGLLNTHLEMQEGGAVIEHVRSADTFPRAFEFAICFALRSYLHILDEYRPAEHADFAKRYLERWRQQFHNIPEVVIDPEYLPL